MLPYIDPTNSHLHPFLSRILFSVGGQPVRVFFLIKTFLFLVFLSLLSQLTRFFILKLVKHHPEFGEHRGFILSRVVSFGIYCVGIFVGINVENINLNTLVILGGTLGVGIGFGLQSLVANLIAGLILLFEQPIHIGDRIEFNDKTGEVVRVGGRSSWIRTYDNAILIIPNSEFVTKQILNWTASDPKIRFAISISVAYGSNIEKVMQILYDLADSHPDVIKNPAPDVILTELGANAITFTLHVWTITRANIFPRVRSDIYLQVLHRFGEEKIELPFPQLDLHFKNSVFPAPASNPH